MSRARLQKGEVLVGKISDVARQLAERHELVELFKVQDLTLKLWNPGIA
jgi:hypothetical protein